MQAGRPALIKKDGGEMLIAIVLDRPLAEAKALVEAPNAFIRGSRGAPFGEGTLSPLRRYLKPLPKGGRGGGGVNEEPKPP